jgi:uncharacterized delta-60 repeat protein
MKLKLQMTLLVIASIYFQSLVKAQNLVPYPLMGNNGAITVDIAGGLDELIRHQLMPDGKLLLGGWGNDLTCNCNHISLMRIDTLCGALDASFGNNGKISHIFDQRSMMLDMAVLANGKIIGAGQNAPDNSLSQQVNAAYRFNADGTPDLSFNGTGWRTDRFDAVSSGINQAVLPLPDGRIYTVGTSTFNVNGGAVGLGVMRYLENGTLDATYSGDGKAWVAMTAPLTNIGGHSALLLPDNAVLWIGFGQESGQPRKVHFAKFDSTGTLDSDFGLNGQLTTPLELSSTNQQRIRAGLLPNGQILIGAKSVNDQFMLARFLPDGTLDDTFGNNGISLVDPTPSNDSPYSFQILEDGSTVQIGGQNANTGYSMVKRDANGTLVSTFGNNGVNPIPLVNPTGQAIYGGLMLSEHSAIVYGAGTTTVPVALAIKLTSNPSIGQFADLGPDVFSCIGEEVILDAGFPGSNYSWTISNSPVTGSSQTFTATTSASYRVTITNTQGCTDRDTVQVQFAAFPQMPEIIEESGELYTLTNEFIQWYLNGGPIDGANSESLVITSNGTYTVSATNSSGCETFSEPYEITTVAVEKLLPANLLIRVYPNPSSEQLFVDLSKLKLKHEAHSLSILDLRGMEVIRQDLPAEKLDEVHMLDIKEIAKGAYMFMLLDSYGNKLNYRQVIKN